MAENSRSKNLKQLAKATAIINRLRSSSTNVKLQRNLGKILAVFCGYMAIYRYHFGNDYCRYFYFIAKDIPSKVPCFAGSSEQLLGLIFSVLIDKDLRASASPWQKQSLFLNFKYLAIFAYGKW